MRAGDTSVWNDVYDGAVARGNSQDVARTLADRVEASMVLASRYQRWSWLRPIKNHLFGKDPWWTLYAFFAFLGLAIGLPVGLIHMTSHYAGLSKKEVLAYAKQDAVSFHTRNLRAEINKFDLNLRLKKIERTNKGPVPFWRATFIDGLSGKRICVMLNSEGYYIGC